MIREIAADADITIKLLENQGLGSHSGVADRNQDGRDGEVELPQSGRRFPRGCGEDSARCCEGDCADRVRDSNEESRYTRMGR